MEKPLVSVIIPIYNTEPYLRRCVDSVLSQTYNNLEIWLVDDGSMDGCPEICDEYAERDSRIRIIHKENEGQSMARNVALDKMSGEYVTFVDSDDYIHSGAIERLLESLIAESADMAVCGIRNGNEDDYFENNQDMSNLATNPNKTVFCGEDTYNALFSDEYREFIAAACGKLYKRAVFRNIRFPKGRIHEDEFVIHHVLGVVKKTIILHMIFYYHFKNPNSITQGAYTLRRLDAVEALDDRCRYFNDLGDEKYIFLAYREYLRKVQYHYYCLEKYFPDDNGIKETIRERYREYYKLIFVEMKPTDRLRYGLFLWLPGANRIIKALMGARSI